MTKSKILKISGNNSLNEVFTKAHYLIDSDRSINETSLKFLLFENIDEADVKKVSDAIKNSRDQIKNVEDFIDQLKKDGFEVSKIKSVSDHLTNLKKALDTAQGEMAAVNFDTGAVSSFLGQTLSLPQIAQAAISIQSKASDFGTGFSNAIKNITDNLDSLVKDENARSLPIRDIAGQGGFPTEEKIKSGIEKSIKKSLGGGFFGKLKGFLGKSLSGPQKKIMSQIPDIDEGEVGTQVADAILDTSIDTLTKGGGIKVAKAPDIAQIADITKDAVELIEDEKEEKSQADSKSGSKESESTAKKSSEPPPLPDEAKEQKSEAEPPPLPEEEGKAEQEKAQEEIKTAVKDEAAESQTPKDAAFGALDAWTASLSKTSQDSLKAKNRIGDLKDIIGVALDDSAKAVEGEVTAAIQAWRDDNEETLMRSRRFAKKNFDALQDLIPKLASAMLKKSNESTLKMTKSNIRKIVFEYLDRKFYKDSDKMLYESNSKYTESEMILYRMNRLAGFDK